MSAEPKPLTAFQQTYHWRNKNCGPWAHEWVKKTLPGTKVDDGSQSASITEVTSVSGDCDLGQRKGKLLTIYDLEVEMKWEGKTKAGEEVKGKLKVPEFSHEAIDGLSDYVFDFSLTSSHNTESEALLAYVRQAIPPLLKDIFNSFRSQLLEAHGVFSDGFSAGATPSGSGTSTPGGVASTSYSPAPPVKSMAQSSTVPTPAATPTPKVGNTVVVETSADLQASADDIWNLLTDPAKIPMWSRSPAKMVLKNGEGFELFDGNVFGKVVEVENGKKLVQSWATRSPGWPSGHFGTMTITLAQGSDSTLVKFSLEGVPSGKESELEQALDTFYIRGLKQMGLGSIL